MRLPGDIRFNDRVRLNAPLNDWGTVVYEGIVKDVDTFERRALVESPNKGDGRWFKLTDLEVLE